MVLGLRRCKRLIALSFMRAQEYPLLKDRHDGRDHPIKRESGGKRNADEDGEDRHDVEHLFVHFARAGPRPWNAGAGARRRPVHGQHFGLEELREARPRSASGIDLEAKFKNPKDDDIDRAGIMDERIKQIKIGRSEAGAQDLIKGDQERQLHQKRQAGRERRNLFFGVKLHHALC